MFSFAQLIMEKKKNLDHQSAHFTAGTQHPAKTLGFNFLLKPLNFLHLRFVGLCGAM